LTVWNNVNDAHARGIVRRDNKDIYDSL